MLFSLICIYLKIFIEKKSFFKKSMYGFKVPKTGYHILVNRCTLVFSFFSSELFQMLYIYIQLFSKEKNGSKKLA